MFGTAGGLIEIKAALLASHGFAALALAYFAYDDLPKSIDDVDFEYFEEAVEWMAQLPQTSPDGLGVLSVSAGSQFSLMLAIHKSDLIKAVVPISPFCFLISPFQYRGKPRWVMNDFDVKNVWKTKDGAIVYRDTLPLEFKTNLNASPSIIPVENIHCPVLFIYGEQDLNVPAEFMVKHMKRRMQDHGKDSQCTVLGYPGAGHLIEPPYTPHCEFSFHKHPGNDFIAWGGETKGHTLAQEDSWYRILQFFHKQLSNNQILSHL